MKQLNINHQRLILQSFSSMVVSISSTWSYQLRACQFWEMIISRYCSKLTIWVGSTSSSFNQFSSIFLMNYDAQSIFFKTSSSSLLIYSQSFSGTNRLYAFLLYCFLLFLIIKFLRFFIPFSTILPVMVSRIKRRIFSSFILESRITYRYSKRRKLHTNSRMVGDPDKKIQCINYWMHSTGRIGRQASATKNRLHENLSPKFKRLLICTLSLKFFWLLISKFKYSFTMSVLNLGSIFFKNRIAMIADFESQKHEKYAASSISLSPTLALTLIKSIFQFISLRFLFIMRVPKSYLKEGLLLTQRSGNRLLLLPLSTFFILVSSPFSMISQFIYMSSNHQWPILLRLPKFREYIWMIFWILSDARWHWSQARCSSALMIPIFWLKWLAKLLVKIFFFLLQHYLQTRRKHLLH